jgi:hypothetical protein
VLLERSCKTGGNLVDTHSNLGSHCIDGACDLGHEHFPGRKIPNSFDLVLRQELAFKKAALGLGFLRLFLKSLNSFNSTTNIVIPDSAS